VSTPDARDSSRRNGRRTLAAICLLAAAASAGCWSTRQRAMIDLPSSSFQAGTVLKGTLIEHRFSFRNKGPAPLVIGEVRSPCRCSSVVTTPRTAPGESGEVLVSVNTTDAEGPFRARFPIITAGSRVPLVFVTVEAVVVPEFVLSERYVDFGVQLQGSAASRTVIITGTAGSTSHIVGVECTDPSTAAWLQAPVTGETSPSTRVLVVQRQNARLGSHFGNLIVQTTSRLSPTIRVPLRGRIVASAR